jgi:hypothetical protein
MRPNLVIVGAGLGGCFLADSLTEQWDVTVVELGSQLPKLQDRVRDTGSAAVTYPHIGSGLGGTTAWWHNGLMEVDEKVFQEKWPFSKSELAPYYARAYEKLAGVSQSNISAAVKLLRQKYKSIGIQGKLLGEELYYPRRRVNAWDSLRLKGRVKVVEGEVIELSHDGKGVIRYLLVKKGDQINEINGDVFVLAAGGLNTPLLLQKLAETLPLPALRHAGLHYEDHPSALVGEVILSKPLYKLWNYPVKGSNGNLRLPLFVKQDGLSISFQLRPAISCRLNCRRDNGASVLSEIRNNPLKLRSYLQLLTHGDDVLEILSFMFRIRLPTRHYSLMMIAEQPSSDSSAVWREYDGATIYRNWVISSSYISALQQSIHQVLNELGDLVKSVNIFPDWTSNIMSSSHHSGTARMATSPCQGLCDENGRVHGMENLYVCDGSLIPASGYANTGLTIAALALRMAGYLRTRYVLEASLNPVTLKDEHLG